MAQASGDILKRFTITYYKLNHIVTSNPCCPFQAEYILEIFESPVKGVGELVLNEQAPPSDHIDQISYVSRGTMITERHQEIIQGRGYF